MTLQIPTMQALFRSQLERSRPDEAAETAAGIAKMCFVVLKRTPAKRRPAELRYILSELKTTRSTFDELGATLESAYCPHLFLIDGLLTARAKSLPQANSLILDLIRELSTLSLADACPARRRLVRNDSLIARCGRAHVMTLMDAPGKALCYLKNTWRLSRGTEVHQFVSGQYREALLGQGATEAAGWLDQAAQAPGDWEPDKRWITDAFLWKQRHKQAQKTASGEPWPPLYFYSMEELLDNELRGGLAEARRNYGALAQAAKALCCGVETAKRLLKSAPILDPNGTEIRSLALLVIQGNRRAVRERMAESLVAMAEHLGSNRDLEVFFETSARSLARIQGRFKAREE